MSLCLTFHLRIVDGLGEFVFPDSLKKDSYSNTISCRGIYSGAHHGNADELIFITSNASYHRLSLDKAYEPNVLGLFEPHSMLSTMHEMGSAIQVPLNRTPPKIQVYFVDQDGKKAELNGHLIIELKGDPANSLLI